MWARSSWSEPYTAAACGTPGDGGGSSDRGEVIGRASALSISSRQSSSPRPLLPGRWLARRGGTLPVKMPPTHRDGRLVGMQANFAPFERLVAGVTADAAPNATPDPAPTAPNPARPGRPRHPG